MFAYTNASSSEKLELIYDMHSVCEAMIHDSLEAAAALFAERVRQLAALSRGSVSNEDAAVMLSSLNRGLYCFFRFCLQMSFAECCHSNEAENPANTPVSSDDIIAAGTHVLKAYRKAYASAQSECDHLERARSYIREHISDKLTLASVSSAINISPSYLSRVFSASSGQTFCEYVRDERIALGCKLLHAGSLSIDEISEHCGFSTPNYFSTVFKKCIGQSPVEYRAALNANKKQSMASLKNDQDSDDR